MTEQRDHGAGKPTAPRRVHPRPGGGQGAGPSPKGSGAAISERLQLAYHEVGHAIVMWHYGFAFRYITLAPKAPGERGKVQPYRPGVPRTLAVYAYLDVHVAGIVAELIHRPGDTPHDGYDIRKMLDVWRQIGVDDLPGSLTYQACYERARVILLLHSGELATAAWVLASRDRALTHREFLALMDHRVGKR